MLDPASITGVNRTCHMAQKHVHARVAERCAAIVGYGWRQKEAARADSLDTHACERGAGPSRALALRARRAAAQRSPASPSPLPWSVAFCGNHDSRAHELGEGPFCFASMGVRCGLLLRAVAMSRFGAAERLRAKQLRA